MKALEAANEILTTPGMLEIVREHMTDLNQMMEPAGTAGVKEALHPLIVGFQPPKRVIDELPAFYGLFQSALADLPLRCIKLAVIAYVKETEWNAWPTVGDIRTRADAFAQKVAMARYRAQVALSTHAPPPPPTDAEREAAAIMAKSLPRVLAENRPPPSSRMRRASWMTDEQWEEAKAKADADAPAGQRWVSGPSRPRSGTPHQVAEQIRSAVPAGDR